MMNNNTKFVKDTNNSPKTPGGISKSYLTPIRRVGLSRNFRKNGRSPFISPLSTYNSETETNKLDTEYRKRIKISSDEEIKNVIDVSKNENITVSPLSCYTAITSDINGTPSRNLSIKKKSKTLLLIDEPISEDLSGTSNNIEDDCNIETITKNPPKRLNNKNAKLCRSNSKNNNEVNDLLPKGECNNKELSKDEVSTSTDNTEKSISTENEKKSPKNLIKECVVVIQNKLLKSISKNKIENEDDSKTKLISTNPVSQILFDSDAEDIPISNIKNKQKYSNNINKVENNINNNTGISLQENDYQENIIKVKKLVDKSTSVSELKTDLKEKKAFKKTTKSPRKIQNPSSSQSSNSYDDDDDDFQFDKKKSIIIKKCYNKVAKPSKAKSTGSITQQDIDEMKDKIEAKKKFLVAKSLTNDTLELRDLIKKWQKGCQKALTELLELMKKTMPDKQNMEYAEILQILRIPPDLVGYDSENDCFVTPDDATIVLSSLNV